MPNPKSSPYLLKFISGKYQGTEFPLELNREVLIGRGSDLDMVLVEDMISRRHARITSYGGSLVIEDLGSTNGTFVNGEKVQRHKLTVGDRILVGTSIIKLVEGDDSAPTDADATGVPAAAAASAPSTSSRRATQPTITGAIAGRLEEVSLPDLLQLFAASRKTGILGLAGEHDARVWLREGRVVFAQIEGEEQMAPEKAFYRILNWRSGTFALEPGLGFDVPGVPMDASTEALMMEGLRQLDEIGNLGSQVPSLEAVLTLPSPLVPPLRSLTPELLDTMQLALNHRQVERILNRSLAPDLETMQDLVYLIDNRYLEVVPT